MSKKNILAILEKTYDRKKKLKRILKKGTENDITRELDKMYGTVEIQRENVGIRVVSKGRGWNSDPRVLNPAMRAFHGTQGADQAQIGRVLYDVQYGKPSEPTAIVHGYYVESAYARKLDLLRRQWQILVKRADAAHNRKWSIPPIPWSKNSKQWKDLKARIDLGRIPEQTVIQSGSERLLYLYCEELGAYAEQYSDKKDKKKDALNANEEEKLAVAKYAGMVSTLALNGDKRKLDLKNPPKNDGTNGVDFFLFLPNRLPKEIDQALIKEYKRELRGDFAVLEYLQELCRKTSSTAGRELRKALDHAAEARENYLLSLGGTDAERGEARAAYEQAFKEVSQRGKELADESETVQRMGKKEKANRRIGRIAQAMRNLDLEAAKADKQDPSVVRHAKEVFADVLNLTRQFKGTMENSHHNTEKSERLYAAAQKFEELLLSILVDRKAVAQDAYADALKNFKDAATQYILKKFPGKAAESIKKHDYEGISFWSASDLRKLNEGNQTRAKLFIACEIRNLCEVQDLKEVRTPVRKISKSGGAVDAKKRGILAQPPVATYPAANLANTAN